jgi:hypothetical protein
MIFVLVVALLIAYNVAHFLLWVLNWVYWVLCIQVSNSVG